MSVRLKIPTQLRELTGGSPELELEATSIKGLIDGLRAGHPELVDRLIDENGDLRRFVNVYVEDEDVRFLEGLDTPLEDRQTVSILPAVAGGRA